MKDSLTIKITSLRVHDDYPEINRIIGSIDANNFAQLIDIAGLAPNPRESKSNKVTDAIMDTLENNPKLMVFKSPVGYAVRTIFMTLDYLLLCRFIGFFGTHSVPYSFIANRQ
jgi:hypothetical protein